MFIDYMKSAFQIHFKNENLAHLLKTSVSTYAGNRDMYIPRKKSEMAYTTSDSAYYRLGRVREIQFSIPSTPTQCLLHSKW